MPNSPDLLRLPRVLEKTGLSRSQLYALEKKGRFPARVEVSPRITAWPSDEVDRWVHDRIAGRLNQKPKKQLFRPKDQATEAAA